MCVDLHIHSIYSDGTATPAELVKIAVGAGLKAISLTDHDTVDGTEEIFEHGKNEALTVISGLEISAVHRDISVHILGYGINHKDCELKNMLAPLQQGRAKRNSTIIAKLQQLGLDVNLDELKTLSRCGQTGRPHIAQLLTSKGIVASPDDAFRLYLRKGAPAWTDRFTYSASQSIDMIHKAGGLAVLAHPGHIAQHMKSLPLLISELVERGLDGLEAYYPNHSDTVRKNLLRLSRKYNLVVTGGSDYHGNNKKYATMACKTNGFCPPASVLPILTDRIISQTDKSVETAL